LYFCTSKASKIEYRTRGVTVERKALLRIH
jgi:hypothetical protein